MSRSRRRRPRLHWYDLACIEDRREATRSAERRDVELLLSTDQWADAWGFDDFDDWCLCWLCWWQMIQPEMYQIEDNLPELETLRFSMADAYAYQRKAGAAA